jgi:hypothetical protein
MNLVHIITLSSHLYLDAYISQVLFSLYHLHTRKINDCISLIHNRVMDRAQEVLCITAKRIWSKKSILIWDLKSCHTVLQISSWRNHAYIHFCVSYCHTTNFNVSFSGGFVTVVPTARLWPVHTVLQTSQTPPRAGFLSVGSTFAVDTVGLYPEPHPSQNTQEPTVIRVPR